MEGKRIRFTKGVLLFLAFIGVALGIVLQPSLGVTALFREIGLDMTYVAIIFVISGFMNLFIGTTGRYWNGLWFAIFFVYNGMTWIVFVSERPMFPVIPAILYTLLSSLLMIDLIMDLREEYLGSNKPR
jgi:hypothetical protein